MSELKNCPSKIEEFNPVDGQFFLISQNGKLLGKAWDLESARIIADAFDQVVKPVRCRECRFKDRELCRAAYRTKYNLKTEKWAYKTMMEDDDYCSCGEREEADNE